MSGRNKRIIDLSAIEGNIRSIREAVPKTAKLLAVVKADAYGHGAAETSRAALSAGADMLAVATVREGTELRNAGIDAPVLVLGAVTDDDAEEGAAGSLIQTVCTPEMVRICEKAAAKAGKQTEVHLKFDTGMGRIGVRNEEERDLVLSAVYESPHVRLTGAFTHFADADGGEEGIRYTKAQYQRFLELTEGLPANVIRHCCNSAAIDRFPEMALDMVRAGISMYGYPPVRSSIPLRPCMRWTAEVSFIKELPHGAFVSYGRTFRSERPLLAATVTCGYGDGYHRAASGKASVLIHGKRAPVIGRICMDQMMADITGIEDVHPGDEVVLIGRSGDEEITAEEIAGWANTISYEILLSAGSRVSREFRTEAEVKER